MPDPVPPQYPTSLGVSTVDSITLFGQDLSDELIGKVGFGALAYQLMTLTAPTPQQQRVFEAVLVALADHGFTPTAIAARLTLLSAPEALQGAVAAGLLGGGSRFLGVTEDTGRFLRDALAGLGESESRPATEAGWDEVATRVLTAAKAAGQRIPGLGHHLHKQGDPRTAALMQVAREEGQFGPYLALFDALGRCAPTVLGRSLPLNGAGTCGAALCDIGIPIELLRGVALLARCAGLLGQLAEELRSPIARSIFEEVEQRAVFLPPQGA